MNGAQKSVFLTRDAKAGAQRLGAEMLAFLVMALLYGPKRKASPFILPTSSVILHNPGHFGLKAADAICLRALRYAYITGTRARYGLSDGRLPHATVPALKKWDTGVQSDRCKQYKISIKT